MALHQALIASGAPITEVNTIRKHFSAVKGGRLAIAAPEATKISILLPDVPCAASTPSPPDPPRPTTPPSMKSATSWRKYDLLAKFPPSVRAFFSAKTCPNLPATRAGWRPSFPAPWKESNRHSNAQALAATMNAEEDAFRDSIFEVLLSSHDLVENARVRPKRPATTPLSTTPATTGIMPKPRVIF
jgi:glycerate 2-kinase